MHPALGEPSDILRSFDGGYLKQKKYPQGSAAGLKCIMGHEMSGDGYQDGAGALFDLRCSGPPKLSGKERSM